MSSTEAPKTKSFRRVAVRYCIANGLIPNDNGVKNRDLLRMITQHATISLPEVGAFLKLKPPSVRRVKTPRPPKLPLAPRGLKPRARTLARADARAKLALRMPDELFFTSREWQELRYKALKEHGAACQCCGATRADGKKMHVDHIKPRSKFPELQWLLSNLQVLCEDCNLGKGAWDQTDWRPPELWDK